MLATWGCTTFPKPTLSLDFLGATSLDSGITFSRGSQATLFDSTGTLRYAKHNLLLQSQTFQTSWTTGSTAITADSTAAPDSTNTADTLYATGGGAAVRFLIQSQSKAASATTYIYSIFLKAKELSFATFSVDDGAGNGFSGGVNLTTGASTGATVGTGGVFTSVSATAVGNGWYKCVLTGTSNTVTTVRVAINLATSLTTGYPSITVNANDGIYLWGAQLNLANMEGGVTSSLTTYYPTTTAAYYAPRFDYNPSTLQPRGLLIEEQRTNLIRNSTGVGAVAGTPGTAPTNWVVGSSATHAPSIIGTGVENGINYVDIQYVVSAGAVAASLIYADTPAATASTAYTGSYFLKLVSGSIPQVRFIWQDGITTVARSFFSITSSLTRYDNTYTTSVGGTLARFVIGIDASAAGTTFVIRVGLPQTEQGAFATSVIPTTTTALTRNADVASMTGTNFSSWYNASQGTILANTTVLAVAPSTALQGVFAINDGTADNRMAVYKRANADVSTRFDVTAATINSCFLNAGTFTTTNRIAAAYATDNFAAVLNGGSPATDTGGAVPTVTQINIGSYVGATSFLNGHIQRLAYYPTRLPNTTLQALTA